MTCVSPLIMLSSFLSFQMILHNQSHDYPMFQQMWLCPWSCWSFSKWSNPSITFSSKTTASSSIDSPTFLSTSFTHIPIPLSTISAGFDGMIFKTHPHYGVTLRSFVDESHPHFALHWVVCWKGTKEKAFFAFKWRKQRHFYYQVVLRWHRQRPLTTETHSSPSKMNPLKTTNAEKVKGKTLWGQHFRHKPNPTLWQGYQKWSPCF